MSDEIKNIEELPEVEDVGANVSSISEAGNDNLLSDEAKEKITEQTDETS